MPALSQHSSEKTLTTRILTELGVLNRDSLFADGLVAFWPLGLYPDARDMSLFGNHGSLEGGLSVSDLTGSGNRLGLKTDGSDDYVDCGYNSLFNTDIITVSAWAYSTNISRYDRIVGGEDRFQLLAGSSDKIFWRIASDDEGWKGGEFDTAISNNIWYHVVGTYDGSTLKAYLNGVQEETTYNHTGTIQDDTETIKIGRKSNEFLNYWIGLLDDIRIYNRALSAAEVKQLYQDTLPGGYGDLLIPARRAATWFVGGADGWTHNIHGISNANVGKIHGISLASIGKVLGA